ncbi:MAG: glycosyltransferase family 4 protein [Planctomycetales bacterium]|nr:glycosyltransferase family 4 protein [Planctomycetales bacterium]
MRVALVQDDIFLPSFGGGLKANRFLLEQLAEAGHSCLALTRCLTNSRDGPRNLTEFQAETEKRQLVVRSPRDGVFEYSHARVAVEAINLSSLQERADHIRRRLQSFKPDAVFVADDKRRYMLAAAVAAAPGRVIPLLQTIMHLPFGPIAIDLCTEQLQLMKSCPGIVVISKYMQAYIHAHSNMNSLIIQPPVYGTSFPNFANFQSGLVTMINPCPYKGVSIFCGLAKEFPGTEFAAVPTWGANDQVLSELTELPNMRLLAPADNIEDILKHTRIMLVPSLWPESFGYVVPEAMARGIPVLAADLGGLPEAKLGVEYLLPVVAATRDGSTYTCPSQDIGPWVAALRELIEDEPAYQSCSHRSREAALRFVTQTSIAPFEKLVAEVALG